MSGVRITEERPGVITIRIDDAASKNALTQEVVSGITTAIEDFGHDDGQKVAVLTGEGTVFCSGGNTRQMGEARPRPLDRKDQMWTRVQRLIREIEMLDKPLIAAINGPAVGAGADLAFHADLRIMSDAAWLRASYVDLAVVPGAGAAWALPRLVGTARALELLWTGRRVEAPEALASGLVLEVVPPAELMDRCLQLAATIAAKPQASVRLIKRMVRQGATSSLPAALDLASSHFAVLQESDDHVEAVQAIREGRSPRFGDR